MKEKNMCESSDYYKLTPKQERYLKAKSTADVILGCVGSVVLSPVFLAIACAIKIEDGITAPVIFKQKRVGSGDECFQMYKFRSMKLDTPHDCPTHLLENPEQYITKVGIVATHDDGNGNHSGNIHCHIIINSVRAVDASELPYDSRPCDQRAGFKHNCTKSLLKYLEQEVVKMCEEQGYHQVDFEKSDKRITNQEYKKVHREQRSKNPEFTSEKEKLREMIDAAISASIDEESLRKYLLVQYGIEVTESRGKWGYRMAGKQKSVRARKLGDRYGKESILKLCRENQMREELTHPETIHLPIISNGETSILYEYQMTISLPPNFGQLIDIERNQKIKNSPAYEQWAKIHNLQIQAEQFAYLSEQGLLQGDSLEKDYQKVSEEYEKVHGELKSLEADLKDLNMQLRLLGQYYSTRKEWKIYNKSGRTEECYQEHKTAIDLHEKVLGQLEEIYEGKKFPDVKWLKSRKGELIRKTKGLTQMSKKYKKYLDAFQSLTEFYIESGEKMYNKKKEAWKNL